MAAPSRPTVRAMSPCGESPRQNGLGLAAGGVLDRDADIRSGVRVCDVVSVAAVQIVVAVIRVDGVVTACGLDPVVATERVEGLVDISADDDVRPQVGAPDLVEGQDRPLRRPGHAPLAQIDLEALERACHVGVGPWTAVEVGPVLGFAGADAVVASAAGYAAVAVAVHDVVLEAADERVVPFTAEHGAAAGGAQEVVSVASGQRVPPLAAP